MNEQLTKYKQFLQARGQNNAYFNVMRIFKGYLEKNNIIEITQQIITDFFIQGNYSNNSKNAFIRAGRNYYSVYLQQEKNAWKEIKLLKVERKIPDYITEKDIDKAKQMLITYYSRKMTLINPLKSSPVESRDVCCSANSYCKKITSW